MEFKRRLEPEIGKEPVTVFSNAEADDMVRRLELMGIYEFPIIQNMTFHQIDKLLNGVPN